MRKKAVEVNIFLNLMKKGGPILDFYNELIEEGLSFDDILKEFDTLAEYGLIEQVLLIRYDGQIYFSTIPRKKQTTSLFLKIEDPTERLLSIFPTLEDNEEVHMFTKLSSLDSVLSINEIPLLPEKNPNTILRLRLFEETDESERYAHTRKEHFLRTLDELWKYSM